MESNKKKGRGAPLILLAGIFWGSMGIFVRSLNAYGFGSVQIVCLRMTVAALLFALLLLLRGRGGFRIALRDVPLFLGLGLMSVLFFTVCYFRAIEIMPLSTAAILLYTSPIWVMLMSALFFREKLTPRKIACVLLSVLGCALVSGLGSGGARLTFRGLLLGLGAGLGYALYSIFSRLIQQRGYSTYTNVCYTFSTAAAAYLAIALGNGSAAEIVRLPGAALLSVLCGLLTGLLAYLLYTAGLRELEPSRAAQLATIEPVVAALLGALLFRQSLSAAEVIGIALVVAAVVGMNLRPRREERR